MTILTIYRALITVALASELLGKDTGNTQGSVHNLVDMPAAEMSGQKTMFVDSLVASLVARAHQVTSLDHDHNDVDISTLGKRWTKASHYLEGAPFLRVCYCAENSKIQIPRDLQELDDLNKLQGLDQLEDLDLKHIFRRHSKVEPWKFSNDEDLRDVYKALAEERKVISNALSPMSKTCSPLILSRKGAEARTKLVTIEIVKRWIEKHVNIKSLIAADFDNVLQFVDSVKELLEGRWALLDQVRTSFQKVASEHRYRQNMAKAQEAADMMEKISAISKHVIKNSFAFLVLYPTNFRGTDQLPFVTPETVWETLLENGKGKYKSHMVEHWRTQCCGLILKAYLSENTTQTLFKLDGKYKGITTHSLNDLLCDRRKKLEPLEARKRYWSGRRTVMKNKGFIPSSLAGEGLRIEWLKAMHVLSNLTYMSGGVFQEASSMAQRAGAMGAVLTVGHLNMDLVLDRMVALTHCLEESLATLNDHLEENWGKKFSFRGTTRKMKERAKEHYKEMFAYSRPSLQNQLSEESSKLKAEATSEGFEELARIVSGNMRNIYDHFRYDHRLRESLGPTALTTLERRFQQPEYASLFGKADPCITIE